MNSSAKLRQLVLKLALLPCFALAGIAYAQMAPSTRPVDARASSDGGPTTDEVYAIANIYVQADPPGEDKASNWLPAPRDDFQPTMRLYSPRAEVLDLTWVPPPLRKVE